MPTAFSLKNKNPPLAKGAKGGFFYLVFYLSRYNDLLGFVSLCPLLTVFGFLPCRARTMGTGDVFLLLGLGLHFVVAACLAASATPEHQSTAFDYLVNLAAHVVMDLVMMMSDGI